MDSQMKRQRRLGGHPTWAQYEALEAELAALRADYSSLSDDYQKLVSALADQRIQFLALREAAEKVTCHNCVDWNGNAFLHCPDCADLRRLLEGGEAATARRLCPVCQEALDDDEVSGSCMHGGPRHRRVMPADQPTVSNK